LTLEHNSNLGSLSREYEALATGPLGHEMGHLATNLNHWENLD